jgi:DNA polymerase-3 subunit beta
MAETISSGGRIGNDLMWIGADRVKISGSDEVVVLTVRKNNCGGEVIARDIASPAHVSALRDIARRIENLLVEVEFQAVATPAAEALEGVALAISTEETRYYLNGVYIHLGGAESRLLTFVATDGHRLSLVRRDCPDGADGMPGVIVPRKTVAEVSKLCRGNPKEARLSISDTKIRFEIGDVTLVSKLIDGTFPEYDRVIPAKTATTASAVIQREATRDAVDRVMTMNAERGRAVKVTIDGATMEMRLDVSDPDRGNATETVGLVSAEPIDIAIGLNGRYLVEALDALGGDTVSIAATDPGSPVLMTPADDLAGTRRLIVVMPMRV